MKTLVIYDNEGYIISTRSGEPTPRIPVGIPYLYVDIPDGKRIKITNGIGVDVTVEPNQVILEDIPSSQIETRATQLEDEHADMLLGLAKVQVGIV